MTNADDSFGPFTFDRASATLWRDGVLVPIGGRGAAVLAALLEATSRVVPRERLMDAAWPGLAVEAGNLAVQVANLRKTLGQRPDGQEWISTVARNGYRLNRQGAELASLSQRPGFAVLPFINMSNDPDQDYLADGMVEDLITAFSCFRQIAVTARQSSFAYRNRATDIRDIARELGVRYLLEGSVRREGDRVRVTAQLIDGDSGAHLWAVRLDGNVGSIFDFQDQITDSVAAIIEPQIRRAEFDRLRRKRPDSFGAYDYYLKGLQMVEGRDTWRIGEAIRLFEKSIDLDPGFAPALARAAALHETRFARSCPVPPGTDDLAEAVALSERALAADPDDAFVLVTAGVIRMIVKGESDQGMELVERAVRANPNNTLVVNIASYAHWFRQDYARAIAFNQRTLAINPSAPERFWAMNGLARAHLAAGRPEEGLLWAMRSLAVNGDQPFTQCVTAACYAHLGRLEEARAALAPVLARKPGLTAEDAVDPGPRPGDLPLVEGLVLAGLPTRAHA